MPHWLGLRRTTAQLRAVVVLVWLMGARVSPAQTADTKRIEQISVVIAGDPEAARELRSVLRDVVGELHVTLEFSTVERVDPRTVLTPKKPENLEEAPLARVWIDLGSEQNATLYLVDRPWERVLVRFIPREPGKDQLTFEQLAQVLAATAEELLAGGRIGVQTERARRELGMAAPPHAPRTKAGISTSRKSPEKARVPPQRYQVSVGLSYEAELYSKSGTLAHGPAAFTWLELQVGSIPLALVASVQYRPLSVDADPVGARLQTVALRAALGAFVLNAERWKVLGAAGIGTDLTHIDPVVGRGAQPDRARWQSTLVLRAFGLAGYKLDKMTALLAVAGADFDFSRLRYVYSESGRTRSVLEPMPVRPLLALGISVSWP